LRKIIALAAVIALSVSLTGCASTNPADVAFEGVKQTCDTYVTGSSADQIEVDSDMSKKPTVSFATPITADEIQTKVVTQGDGPKFTGNELVDIEYIGLSGGNGKEFQASKFDGTDFVSQFMAAGGTPDFCHALSGVRAGSRVAVLFPAAAAHAGQGIPDLNIAADESIVFVFDLLKVFLPRATGTDKGNGVGFPAVVRDPKTGQPGITVTGGAAPTEFKSHVLIEGKGETVKKGQVITLHYSGFLWDTGTVFDSSWDKGQPTQFSLVDGQLIPGFIKALEGQKVGSQVIGVIPPSDGYGNQEQGSIPANSTLIFVVDILGANDATK
jgi:peptidylprolyl isomerase